jgi:hypothetical protein
VVSSVPNGFSAKQRYIALSDVSHAVISNVHTPCTQDVIHRESASPICVRSLNQCTY